MNFCTADGGYGSGWKSYYGSFWVHADSNGISADMACCQCGGGSSSARMTLYGDCNSNADAGGYTCVARIDWLKLMMRMSDRDARNKVALTWPDECGGCASVELQITQKKAFLREMKELA